MAKIKRRDQGAQSDHVFFKRFPHRVARIRRAFPDELKWMKAGDVPGGLMACIITVRTKLGKQDYVRIPLATHPGDDLDDIPEVQIRKLFDDWLEFAQKPETQRAWGWQ